MRRSKRSQIEAYIKKKPVCKISDILAEFSLSQASVSKYLTTLGVLKSYNLKRQYCILPEDKKFDEQGFLVIGDVRFFKGGQLLDAVCDLVEKSPAGLGARELDKILKTSTHSQLPKIFRRGRLQRDPAQDRAGNAFIYFSADNSKAKVQREALLESRTAPDAIVEVPEEPLGNDELPDVIEVILTLIKHPDYNAKSISLSLQRRGKKIGMDFVSRALLQYDLSKKKF